MQNNRRALPYNNIFFSLSFVFLSTIVTNNTRLKSLRAITYLSISDYTICAGVHKKKKKNTLYTFRIFRVAPGSVTNNIGINLHNGRGARARARLPAKDFRTNSPGRQRFSRYGYDYARTRCETVATSSVGG